MKIVHVLQVKVYPCHINDSEFANALVDSFLDISQDICKDSSSSLQIPIPEANQDLHKDTVSNMESSWLGQIPYSPNSFPDARPGVVLIFEFMYNCGKYGLINRSIGVIDRKCNLYFF